VEEGVSLRGQIEVAVIDALAPLRRSAGRYFAAIDHYNGELDAARGPDDIRQALSGRAPALLVTTSGSRGETKGTGRQESRVTLHVELVIISNHLRSLVAQNLGAGSLDPTADPGSYAMLEDVQASLHGRRLGIPGVEIVVWDSDDVIIQLPDLTAWRSVYTTRYRIARETIPGVPLDSIEHRHNLDQAAAANPVVIAELPPLPEVTP
jgi:phage gp37-like protein